MRNCASAHVNKARKDRHGPHRSDQGGVCAVSGQRPAGPDPHAQSGAAARAGRLSRRPQGERRGSLCGLWPGERPGVRAARRPDRLAGQVRTDADRPAGGALGPLLHRRISERRRLRRDDPRSRLSRGGEASPGGGGGFPADPARRAAGRQEFWRDPE